MPDRKQKDHRKGKAATKQSDARRQGPGQTPTGPKGSFAFEAQVLAMGRRNLVFLGSGIALIILGFVLLAAGDVTIAPILLLVGYLGLIPIGLVAGSHKDEEEAITPASGESARGD